MGENLLSQIQHLILSLPSKDIPLGEKLIKERDFESLKELINSTIQINKNREENGKEPLIKDSVELAILQDKVDEYCSLLGIYELGEEEKEEFKDFDDCEIWDDYD